MTAARLIVTVQKAVRAGGVPLAAELRQWIEAAAGREARGEVTVRVVGEQESAALNGRYRGRNGPTNVLAFPADAEVRALGLPAAHGEPLPLGDVIVCAPVVAREAEAQGKALRAHWAHIVVHGTLHLVGYDHDNDIEARIMEDKERELLADFGFEDPYSLDCQ